jgi:DNA-binding response OmpR family regulator
VDDEPDLASLFKEFLRKEGFNVVSFTDPILASEYFRETWDKTFIDNNRFENARYVWIRSCEEHTRN